MEDTGLTALADMFDFLPQYILFPIYEASTTTIVV